MKNNYCVIGSPIAHSLSPIIHNTLYRIYNMQDCEYSAVEVNKDTLISFINEIPNNNIKGFNITMPLKASVIPKLTYIDFSVLNGCNTVKVTPHGLFGYSTDAAGFYKSLLINGYDYKDKNIVFLGFGGVTLSLIKDALQKGAKKVTALNRTLSKIDSIKNIAVIDSLDNWGKYLKDCDILINTTPMGMKHCNATLNYKLLRELKKGSAICDLIYDPPQTPLLKTASDLGYFTLNGLDMLIWQAFYAFEIFFGIMPNLNDYKTVKDVINRQKNLEKNQ